MKLDPSKAQRKTPRRKDGREWVLDPSPKTLANTVRQKDYYLTEQLLDAGASLEPGLLVSVIVNRGLESPRLLLLYGAVADSAPVSSDG
jgi:hypothetical protein